MVLLAADGVAIEAVYEPADSDADVTHDAAGRVPVTVVAHGFTGSAGRPHVRRAAAVFRRYGAVITFSFRGHGASGGRSTVGDREVLDLAAAVAWARRLGHRTVWTVGFSMGGSVVLRHAALYPAGGPGPHTSGHADGHGSGLADPHGPAHTDAVVAVSAPARWYYRGTAAMRRLHWVVTRPLGRAVGRYGLRTRIHTSDWDPVPEFTDSVRSFHVPELPGTRAWPPRMPVRRTIGMVFQRPNPFPTMSIYDNVAAGLRLNGKTKKADLSDV
ncbi:alpha/beta fold hydrolase, partial [Streptomyces albidoflavus]|uniref:alpha/beta fold hydrolase n=1 Tax=Streptomyces albidoflavus TaxID=1886 RepID=UPI00211BE225